MSVHPAVHLQVSLCSVQIPLYAYRLMHRTLTKEVRWVLVVVDGVDGELAAWQDPLVEHHVVCDDAVLPLRVLHGGQFIVAQDEHQLVIPVRRVRIVVVVEVDKVRSSCVADQILCLASERVNQGCLGDELAHHYIAHL